MITKEKFLRYEEVRQSGVTNMFAIKTVIALTGLDQKEVWEIMKKYSILREKYINER